MATSYLYLSTSRDVNISFNNWGQKSLGSDTLLKSFVAKGGSKVKVASLPRMVAAGFYGLQFGIDVPSAPYRFSFVILMKGRDLGSFIWWRGLGTGSESPQRWVNDHNSHSVHGAGAALSYAGKGTAGYDDIYVSVS